MIAPRAEIVETVFARCGARRPPLAYGRMEAIHPRHGTAACPCDRTRRVWLPALAAIALGIVSGCASPIGEPPTVQYTRDDWTYLASQGAKLTTYHYTIFTTCRNRPFVDVLPTFLESCWSAYAELLPTDHRPADRLETYLFQARWQWDRFTDEFTGARAVTYKQIRSGGYSEQGKTVSHYGSRRSTLSILAHEGLHQYLEVTHGKPVPAWVNEGLACYFESFDLENDGTPIFRPEDNTLRRPALREAYSRGALQPLTAILGTHAGKEIHKSSREVLSYYAQAWSMVVFLMRPARENPYHDGFREMLRELGSEAMARRARAYMAADMDGTMSEGEAIFRAYVTDDLALFEQRYRDWLPGFLKLAV
jgi:hypothetical protein